MAKAATLEEMLQAPFSGDEIKQREGRAGLMFDYIDSRTAMGRLDDVLGIGGWQFEVAHVVADKVVGRLTVFTEDGPRVHEDVGYPNGPNDEEPLKSAVSDAIKRCAVQVGVGRHLYFDAVPQQARRQNAPQRPAPTEQTDSSWVCPEHGAENVRSGRGGLFCSHKGGSNTNERGYCNYNDRNTKPVEARPRTNEGQNQPGAPEEPEGLMDDLPF